MLCFVADDTGELHPFDRHWVGPLNQELPLLQKLLHGKKVTWLLPSSALPPAQQ